MVILLFANSVFYDILTCRNGMNTMAGAGKIPGIVALALYIIIIVLIIAFIAMAGAGAMSGLYYYYYY